MVWLQYTGYGHSLHPVCPFCSDAGNAAYTLRLTLFSTFLRVILLYSVTLSAKIRNTNLQRRIALKHTATLEDTRHSFDEMASSLQNHFQKINPEEPENVKLANEYYKWTSLKTNLLLNEKAFQIPSSALPNVIKPSAFKWLHSDKQAVVSKYYQYDKATDKYVIAVKKVSCRNRILS